MSAPDEFIYIVPAQFLNAKQQPAARVGVDPRGVVERLHREE